MALLEPLIYQRAIRMYELLFGLIIMAVLALMLNIDSHNTQGIFLALASVMMGVLMTLLNGQLTHKHDAPALVFYELLSGVVFLSVYFICVTQAPLTLFYLTLPNFIFMLVLASLCTAYALTASVRVMKQLSPYTVVLSTNLEPIYGMILAYYFIGGAEQMTPSFYSASLILIALVMINAYLKNKTQ